MTAVASPRPTSLWIRSIRWDLAFVVLTPLFAVPLLFAWRESSGDRVVYASIMAFGALGHHLPGMLRAYGDRALFRRFRTRFLLAPLFLAFVCAWSRSHGLVGITIVALGWGIWHGFMQAYGFARIYDSKIGAVDRRTARLDFLLCATWFLGAVLISPFRGYQVLDLFAQAGIPAPSHAAVEGLRTAAVVAMGGASVAWVAHAAMAARAGRPHSAVKQISLVTTLALWWVATNAVPSLIFGLALFEICHDVQYLAIVWAYNRRRADSGANSVADSGAFTRWLFRGGFVSAALYLGLVLGYGALGPLAERVGEENLRDVLAGFILASQLLHFYFDGFLWKVRETDTRAALGLEGAGGAVARSIPALRHLALWSLLVIPVAGLWWSQSRDFDKVAVAAALSSALPDSADAWTRHGLALAAADRADAALPALRSALLRDPDSADRRDDLARTAALAAEGRLEQGDRVGARSLLDEAKAAVPQLVIRLRELVEMRRSNRDGPGTLRAFGLVELCEPYGDSPLDRARLLAEFGRHEAALAALDEYRAAGGRHADAEKLRAWLRGQGARR
ncbi:MAG: hypothetical protein AB7I19_05025 [Planctomycetota bacterium]